MASRTAPSLVAIAKAAGVSSSTAARALGGYGSVSQKAADRVHAAAEELGYRPNSLARSMKTGSSRTVGLVIADIDNPFFAALTRGFTDAARSRGFDVLLANTDEDVTIEADVVRLMMEKQVDGLAVAPASRTATAHLLQIQQEGIELVLVDRRVPSLLADTVLVDSAAATREATSYLLSKGHTRIALITGASPFEFAESRSEISKMKSPVEDRVDGYRRALCEAGVDLCVDYLKIGDFHREAAGALALELMSASVPPTAILSLDSVLTAGILGALLDHGYAIPTDVSLVGFDDPNWSTLVRPQLTALVQPVNQIGTLAAERLMMRIAGNASQPSMLQLTAQLVERASVADLNRRAS